MNPEIKKRIEQIQKGMVPEGYKKTKVGIVPDEWDKYKFVNLFSAISEFTVDTETYPLHSLTIENGVIPKSERYERGFLIQKTEDTYKIVRENQFVYNPMNLRFGAIARYKGMNPISVSGYYDVFSCIDRKDIIFMDFFLKSEKLINFYNRMATGSLIEKQRVHFSQFLHFELPLPSINECEKIAEILSIWDKAIELKEQLIVEEKQQKKWLMQNLLTGNKRLPGFTCKWQEVRLGDLGELVRGKGVNRSNIVETGFPFISYGEIYTTHNIKIKEYRTFITSKGREECFRIYKGDIIFTGSGESAKEIGKAVVFLFDDEAYAGGDTIVLTQKSNDSLFLTYMLNSDHVINQLASLGQGNSVVHIYPFHLAQISFPLPPRLEQTAISEILSTADHEIDLHEKQLDELKKQKKALMQLLLTGIVRVNAEEVI